MEFYKIEIVIANTFLETLIEQLEDLGVQGYTAIEITRGKGIKRGEHLTEGLLPTTRSSLIFTVCKEEITEKVVRHIQPFLDKRGGVIITYKIHYASGLS